MSDAGQGASDGPATIRLPRVQLTGNTKFAAAGDFNSPPPSGGSDEDTVRVPHLGQTQEPEPPRNRRGAAKAALITGCSLLVILAIAAGMAWNDSSVTRPLGLNALFAGTVAPAPPGSVNPVLGQLPGSAPIPTAAGLNATLAGPSANPELKKFGGIVVDPSNDQVLWKKAATDIFTPASSQKLLTGAAVLLGLDHESRFTTKVVQGAEPGTVVLVGGGDVTLISGAQTRFPGAAKLDDLAAGLKGQKISKILVDISRYTGDPMAPGWDVADIRAGDQGNIAPMQPLMMDAGRDRPLEDTSPRQERPALTVGQALAQRLGVDPNAVSLGNAPANAQSIAEVQSPTFPRLLAMGLQDSDNVLLEALGRELAIKQGKPASFAGVTQAVLGTLKQNGIDTDGAVMFDASGLSTQDKLHPQALANVLSAAVKDGPLTPKLRPLLDGLPVAGGTGSLVKRYDQPAGQPGRGWVRAKTGSLTGVNALAGIVTDVDGKLLVFAMISNDSNPFTARPALDAVAAAIRGCGCRQ
ncbi:D-alanyl-D-alanine carboxypeptidase/D-alanyl-D-alanine-endopeptidase [Pseudonocardiaceae bacterium YIM PH 21723]|nr:D-alanyl-D-alanine carboxypeptidase/D-alanyl-D-alanine-endopeptidase [Pseudonocardiaceae bacterium YIM PH 21723]